MDATPTLPESIRSRDDQIADIFAASRKRAMLQLALNAVAIVTAFLAVSHARFSARQQECREAPPELYFFDRDGRDLHPPSRWGADTPIDDPTAILHAVEDTVEKARAWSFDPAVNDENIAWAYAHLPQDSEARKVFQVWLKKLQAGDYTTVRYKHVSTMPEGAFTFIVVWQEMRQPAKGKLQEVQLRGRIEVTIWPVSAITSTWRALNHSGVFIQNANIVEEYTRELSPKEQTK